MIRRIREGLAWRIRPWQRYAFLATKFRNGFGLAAQYRRHQPCDCVVLWDGTVLTYPRECHGMLETILEIWHDQVYTGTYYHPGHGDVVVDAGANVGLFSVWFARQHQDCQVIAFEPFTENFQTLEKNIASARVTNVKVHRAGLGAGPGFGQMEAVGQRSLDHRLIVNASAQPDSFPVYSFADVIELSSRKNIALFKVDIEGSEYDLFESARSEDLGRVQKFAIEYHEHLRPGVLDLLRLKLAATHELKVVSFRPEYGMLYASKKPEVE